MRRLATTARLLWALAWLSCSLLAFVPAPTQATWGVAMVLEGTVLWCFALSALVFLPGFRRSKVDKVAAAIGALAMFGFASIPMRAHRVLSNPTAQVVSGDAALVTNDDPIALDWGALVMASEPSGEPPTTMTFNAPGGPKLALDLYRPRHIEGTAAPVIVVVHGGAWSMGSRKEMIALNHHWVDRGFAVAAIEYRLAPRSRFPAPNEDLLAALDFLRAHQQHLHIDADRVVVLGRSAGGQIALSAVYGRVLPHVRGVVAIYPPIDLADLYAYPGATAVLDVRSAIADYLGGAPGRDPARDAAASATLAIDAHDPPTLLVHGRLDEVVPVRQSIAFARALTRMGVPHVLLTIPWGHHGFDFAYSGASGQVSRAAVDAFLDHVLRAPPGA